MKIIVFGSTGGTGKQLVMKALQQNHEVTAFARNPNKVDINHPNLTLFKGDVLNYEEVSNAMVGQKGVLCALGVGKQMFSKSLVHSIGTNNIIKAMNENNTSRIVCETAVLIGDAVEGMSAAGKIYIKLMSLIAPRIILKKKKNKRS